MANNFDDGTVMKVPIGGGASTTLASQQDAPSALAVDANSVYWAAAGVMKVSLAGGTPTTLVSAIAAGIAVDGTSLYWTDGLNVMKIPLVGGVTAMLASRQNGSAAIALGASMVYWTNVPGAGGGCDEASVLGVPIAGGIPTTLASGQSYPRHIATDSTSVYWTNATCVLKVVASD
jgi:hypothetical protein